MDQETFNKKMDELDRKNPRPINNFYSAERIAAIAASAAAPQAPAKLPKWIDDKKGSDPLVDDLIAYIEQHAAPQVVADERAYVKNLELVIERLKDMRHLYPQSHVSDLAKEALVCARAALQAAAVQAQEPFMFGIMGPDGKAHLDENCVGPDAESLYAELNGLNDDPAAGYSIVKLFTAPVQPVAVPDSPTLTVPSDEQIYAHYQKLHLPHSPVIWTAALGTVRAVLNAQANAAAFAPPTAAKDVCAEMRALCSACGGTGDVHGLDGEWRGQCTCLHAWQQRAEKAEARVKELERALSNGTAKPSLLNSDSFVGSNEQT